VAFTDHAKIVGMSEKCNSLYCAAMCKLGLLFLLVITAVAQDQSTRFDQITKNRADTKRFMGNVLVAKGDHVLFEKSYGSANMEWNVPNTAESKFRIGSVTKQFTAASILLLEERGKLKTEDLVSTYVPNAPAAWSKITIYHLLTHTSGIPSFTGFPEYEQFQTQPTTPEKLLAFFRDKPLEFEPGSKWNYSNSGYEVLGYVIEKVTGQTYQHFLDENIFKPLNMTDSGYDSNSLVIPHHAYGYTPGPHGIRVAGYVDMTVPYSAGALYSTTHDLLKWERALFGGRLLKPASLQKMITPFKNDYGCGLTITTINGRKRIEHGGGIQGFNAEVAYWPDDQMTVVVLANLNGSAASDIAADLAATLHGEKVTLPSERKEITLTPEQLKPFIGRYLLTSTINVDITLDGKQLETQLTGQPKFPLFAESPTSFFLKVVDAEVRFDKDASGKVTQLTIHQGGRDTVAKKVSDTVPAPLPHHEISIAPDKLKDYVGTYALASGFTLTITLAADHLEAQATNQPKVPIVAEAPDKFFYKVVEAQLDFGRDASGAVTQVTLHQGGRDITGKKQ
jgi:CubicO group peptidase (beta-lactamase class C family)